MATIARTSVKLFSLTKNGGQPSWKAMSALDKMAVQKCNMSTGEF